MIKFPETTPANTNNDELSNESNDELDWDDDNFEPAEVVLPVAQNPTEPKQEDNKDEDDWLSPLSRDNVKQTPANTGKNQEYLTKQFERLSTPASGKKSRCVICTRPVADGNSKHCVKCQKKETDQETH